MSTFIIKYKEYPPKEIKFPDGEVRKVRFIEEGIIFFEDGRCTLCFPAGKNKLEVARIG